MKYKVNLSFEVFELGNTYYAEYILRANDNHSAINKAIIKLLKEYNPVTFRWNTCAEYTPSFKNYEPLCESFARGY